MAKKIDMGEPIQECCPTPAKKTKGPRKYYPSLSVPENLGAAAVGKGVSFHVEGRVIGVREESRDGQGTKRRTEIEVRAVTLSSGKGGGAKRGSQLADYSKHRKATSRAGG